MSPGGPARPGRDAEDRRLVNGGCGSAGVRRGLDAQDICPDTEVRPVLVSLFFLPLNPFPHPPPDAFVLLPSLEQAHLPEPFP